MPSVDRQQDLADAAQEELARACELGWRDLSQVTPWGDTYEGFTPAGRSAQFERNYLWELEPLGDIRVEVVVYQPEAYEKGVRLARILTRSGGSHFANVPHRSLEMTPSRCPCCGKRTLHGRGQDEICKVCFWEDDGQDDHDADEVRGGPNGELSLTQARKNYLSFGAAERRFLANVRPPTDEEL